MTTFNKRWVGSGCIALFVLSLLQGCYSLGPSFREAEFDESKEALIYVYRGSTLNSSFWRHVITVDETVVNELHSNGYVFCVVQPGRHVVRRIDRQGFSLLPPKSGSTITAPQANSIFLSAERVEVFLNAGEVAYLRDRVYELIAVDKTRGAREIASKRFEGSWQLAAAEH